MLLGETLRRSADRWPNEEALVQDDRRLTYAEWNALVDRFADGLRAHGVRVGDRVAVLTYNSIEQVTALLATQKFGAVAVPLNHRLSPGEVSHLLEQSDAVALLHAPELDDTVRAALESTDGPETVISTGDATPSSLAFDDIVADGNPGIPPAPIEPTETSIMLHTSGTTGLPKLVAIDHRSHWLNDLLCAADLEYRHDDRTLHLAPLFHSGPLHSMFLPHVHIGATNVIQRRFDPEAALELIERESVTSFMGVPTHFRRFRQHGIERPLDSLRFVITTGAPLADDLSRWVETTLCGDVINVYGLTEATSLLTVRRGASSAESSNVDAGSSIGRPLLDVDVRVIEPREDAAPEETVDRGQRGQLIARTEKLMQGYHNRPEGTAEKLRDGWLYTGDVVVRDDRGSLHLVDRIDNMIITGGENVYPQEVERVLLTHPSVTDCAVVGRPDPDLGERVAAYVVGEEAFTLDELDSFWRERGLVAAFKRPRELHFVDAIPKNASGKILRRKLGEGD